MLDAYLLVGRGLVGKLFMSGPGGGNMEWTLGLAGRAGLLRFGPSQTSWLVWIMWTSLATSLDGVEARVWTGVIRGCPGLIQTDKWHCCC